MPNICERCDNGNLDPDHTCLVVGINAQEAYKSQNRCPIAIVDGRVGEFIDGEFCTYDQIAHPDIDTVMNIFDLQTERGEF